MIRIRVGKIIDILEENIDIQMGIIEIDHKKFKVINYPTITGRIEKNDIVTVNTTAVSLNLGTGGYHFVMGKENNTKLSCDNKGHIMKMRYTPQQIKVLSIEEEDSPYHQIIKDFKSLNKAPVLIGFLHSMLIPAIAGIKAINPNLKITYIMTDGGALPMSFSKTVKLLNNLNWLDSTMTVGNAFGGKLEAVNIYSGLVGAHEILKPDIIIVIMGPGIVGTGTEYGTSALEVGQIINAVHTLGGSPIVIPRITFHDERERHKGLSHHVLTALNKVALKSATIVLPEMLDKDLSSYINKQLEESDINNKHSLIYENGNLGLKYLNKHELNVKTMGRDIKEEKEFFMTCCAAGTYTAKLLNKN